MRAGKAYISSLGTTGLLIASSLLLLAVVGAFVAFDRWPDHAAADTQVVPIAGAPPAAEPETAPARPAGDRASAAQRKRLERALVRAARPGAQVVGVQIAADADSLATAPAADPVVSDLPAPDAAASPAAGRTPPAAPAGPQPPAPATGARPGLPEMDEVTAALPADGVDGATGPLAGPVGQVSPDLGGTIRTTSGTIESTLTALAEGRGAR